MNDSIEYLTPKIDGQGDGFRKIAIRKRHPVDASRKFNARTPKDETLKVKLEKAILDMKSPRRIIQHSCIKKSNSVAEITPTKTKAKKKPAHQSKTPSNEDSSSDITLFATPRPFDYTIVMCPRQRAVCLVYQRLLLCAWRRNKARHKQLTDLYQQQQNITSQLELQVEVLNSLRSSESEKRHEALNECHILKNQLEQIEEENVRLKESLKDTEDALDNTKANLLLTKEDLQHCSEQLKRIQGQLKKKMEEKMDLVYKLNERERELQHKDIDIKELEEKLTTTEMNLQNTASNLKTKQEEISEVLEQLQNEVCLNHSLREEMEKTKEENIELEQHSRYLEDELNNYVNSCEELTNENITIRKDLEIIAEEMEQEKIKWYRKLQKSELTKVSVNVVRKVSEIVLPFVLDRGIYF